jgi:hypothetical protein
MTPQEQQLLEGLTSRINQTVLNEKDSEAEQYLQQSLGRNPDALYILAQTVLVQQYALDQAKQQLDQANQQLDQLKQQAAQPQKHASFLGSLLGSNDPAPPPPPPSQYTPVNNPGPAYGAPQYGAPQYSQPQYAQPGYGQPAYGQPQGGGFLRSAMQTATGVAAGALAFEGIESLMHGFDHHAGYGMGGFDGGGSRPEIINNYYDDDRNRGDLSNRFENAGGHPSSDIEDRRDDSFADSNNAYADTDSFVDNTSSADDGGGDFSSDGSSDDGS